MSGHWARGYLGLAGADQNGGNGGGGGLVVREKSYDETRDITTYDKTWQEVYDAISAGALVIMENSTPYGSALVYCTFVGMDDGAYAVAFNMIASSSDPLVLKADSPDDYLDDGSHDPK